MTHCLFFDCDGTLVDSERLCNIALVQKFEPLGIQLDADELVLKFRGWKLAKILQTLEAEHNIQLAADFVPTYRALVSDLFSTELKPIAGIKTVLKELPQAKAVVSSGPLDKIQHALAVCGLSDYFNTLYSSYEVGIWKPDPGIYLHAANDMGFAPEDCAVIEDGEVGVQAALAAGMKTYHFTESSSVKHANLTLFSSMAQLLTLL